MSTYTFSLVTGGAPKYKKDSGPYHIIKNTDLIDPVDTTRIVMKTHSGQEVIDLSVDTVNVGGVAYGVGGTTSDINLLYDALNPLFSKANTGTGGSGTTDYALLTNKPFTDAEVAQLKQILSVNNP
jgi:hypothetical protein